MGEQNIPVISRGVGGGLNEGLEGGVHQLLRARHLRLEMELNVQGVDRVRIGAVSLPSGKRSKSSRAAVMASICCDGTQSASFGLVLNGLVLSVWVICRPPEGRHRRTKRSAVLTEVLVILVLHLQRCCSGPLHFLFALAAYYDPSIHLNLLSFYLITINFINPIQ